MTASHPANWFDLYKRDQGDTQRIMVKLSAISLQLSTALNPPSQKMSTTIFIVALAMLAMVNAAPVQEDQKNLQGLLDVLADQKTNKESIAQVAELIKQQQDDDGSQETEAQFFGKLARHALSLWANKQQDDDNGNQAEAQFFGKLARHALSLWANKQQDDGDDRADAQFWGLLARTVLKHAAPHAISYLGNKLG